MTADNGDLSADIKIGADASGVEVGVGRAKRSLAELGAAADQAGRQGGEGINAIGAGGEGAARRLDAATRQMVNSLQRQIAATEAGGTATRQYQETIARLRGADLNVLRPYLEQLDQAKQKADDASRATSSLGSSFSLLNGAASLAGAAVGTLLSTLSVGAVTAFVRGINDGVDALNDVKDATGSTIENISALEDVARRAGGTLDVVSTSMVKLNQALADAKPGSQQALILKQLNLDAAELRQLDPAEDLLRVATALSQFADDGNKARAVQELFGKSLREVAPFLNDLAEKGQLVSTVTAAQAAEAERLNKQIFELEKMALDASRALLDRMMPGLLQVMGAMRDGVREGGLLLGVYRGLSEFAGIAFGTDKLGKDISAAKSAAAEIQRINGLMIGVQATLERDPGNATAQRRLDSLRAQLEAVQRQAMAATDAIKGAVGVKPPEAEEARSTLDVPDATDLKAREDAARKAAEDRKREIAERIKLINELAGLSGSFQQDWARLTAMYQEGQISLDQLTKAQADLLAKQPAIKAAADEEAKAREAATKAAQAAADVRRKEADDISAWIRAQEAAAAAALQSVNQRAQALRDEEAAVELARVQNISLAEAIEQVAIARLREKQAGFYEGSEGYEAIEREIAARKELAELVAGKAQREAAADAAREAEREWKRTADSIEQSLTDALLRGFESGKGFARNLRDTLANMFRTLVLRPVISAIVNPVALGITSLLGFSGPAAAAASAGGGALSTVGSIASGASLLGGGFGMGLRAGLGGLFGEAGLFGTLDAGFTALGAGNIAGGLGTIAGALGPIMLGVTALLSIAKATKGESRSGGQYSYVFDDGVLTNNRRGTSTITSDRGAVYLEGAGFGAGKYDEDAVKQAINGTVGSINALFKGLGSSLSLTAFQAGFETSGKGRGGVFAGGTLSDGQTFGESGKGDNYAGTLFEQTSTQSPDMKTALENFSLDLKQATIQALQKAGDIPQAIKDKIANIDAEQLSNEAADALLLAINAQIEGVSRLRDAFDTMGLEDLADIAFDAAAGLAEAAGGFDKLLPALDRYYQNYYSEEERRANLQRRVDEQFDKLGISKPQGRDEYRQLVEDNIRRAEEQRKARDQLVSTFIKDPGSLVTGGGVEALSKLPGLSGLDPALLGNGPADPARQEALNAFMSDLGKVFASGKTPAEIETSVSDLVRLNSAVLGMGDDAATTVAALLEVGDAFAELNDSAEQIAQRERDAREAAYRSLERAVAAERNALDQRLQIARDLVSKVSGVFDLLRDSVASLYADVESTALQSAEEGRAFIANAAATAAVTGALPGRDDLDAAIRAATAGISDEALTTFERDRARLILAGQLSQLEDQAGAQLSAAERQIIELEAQGKQLDDLLQYYRDQIDIANGNLEATVSVEQAVRDIEKILTKSDTPTGEGGAGGAAGGGGSGAVFGLNTAPAAGYTISETGLRTYDDGSTYQLTESELDLYRRGLLGKPVLSTAIPRLATGTNYVPRDMFAQIHEGEAVVPKAFNPWAQGAAPVGSADLVTELRALRDEVVELRGQVSYGNAINKQAADALQNNGQPLRVEVIT
ncbi:MAG: hypothetical protein ACK40S_01650 [Burkholderiaceae bacterium]